MKTLIPLLLSLLIFTAIQSCTSADNADQANHSNWKRDAGKAVNCNSY